jgi:hypothetical protein
MGTQTHFRCSITEGSLWRPYGLLGSLLLVFSLGSIAVEAQTGTASVPLCEVLQSPTKFDKQTIQIRGNVHLAFEDFSLDSDACLNAWPRIWLAFGGDVATPTMSTANDTFRPPGTLPRLGGVPVTLTKDDNFERFVTLISARHGRSPLYRVAASLTGFFLAGNSKSKTNGGPQIPGYGHLGGYFLFVITRVDEVDADPTAQLTVSGTVTDTDGIAMAGVDVYSQTVNCCQPWVSRARSDAAGNFAIKIAGQVLTFLKTGYAPQSLVLETGRNDIHIILQSKPTYDWQIPACKANASMNQFRGLPLRLYKLEGFHTERISPSPNPLFVIRRRGDNNSFIRLSTGRGPYGDMASRIFDSESSAQRNVLDAQGKPIGIDGTGKIENYGAWRILSLPGQEVVEYDAVSPATARLFDAVIDSACFAVH